MKDVPLTEDGSKQLQNEGQSKPRTSVSFSLDEDDESDEDFLWEMDSPPTRMNEASELDRLGMGVGERWDNNLAKYHVTP